MEAAREPDVGVRGPAEVDGERVGEVLGIEVGRVPQMPIGCRRRCARRSGRSRSSVAMRPPSVTGDSNRMSSSIGRRPQRRVGDQPLPLVGVAGEVAEEARQRRGDGVEPGDHQQPEDVEEVLAGEALALHLGREEPPSRSSPGSAAPSRSSSSAVEVVVDPHDGFLAASHRLVERQRGELVAEHEALEVQEVVEVGERAARGSRGRSSTAAARTTAVRVDLAAVDERVDHLVGERAHVVGQRRDRASR